MGCHIAVHLVFNVFELSYTSKPGTAFTSFIIKKSLIFFSKGWSHPDLFFPVPICNNFLKCLVKAIQFHEYSECFNFLFHAWIYVAPLINFIIIWNLAYLFEGLFISRSFLHIKGQLCVPSCLHEPSIHYWCLVTIIFITLLHTIFTNRSRRKLYWFILLLMSDIILYKSWHHSWV